MATFYEIHASEFSKSRFRIWPLVRQFLDSLPSNSRVLDIGCGNGKNMKYRKDLNIVGLEYSQNLLNICHKQNLEVIQGDARNIPFTHKSFDAIIMIAVIHHITPLEHYKVLKEIERILVPGGKCMITNWALEQPQNSRRHFTKGLNMVTWKDKDTEPLPYWVMNRELADEFINAIPSGIQFIKLDWDGGNWYFIFQKR
jgi:ubiquinone/menaquinone biosynthesis C-methylase UbiE